MLLLDININQPFDSCPPLEVVICSTSGSLCVRRWKRMEVHTQAGDWG